MGNMSQSELYKNIENGFEEIKNSSKNIKYKEIELRKNQAYVYCIESYKYIVIGNKGSDNLKELNYLINLLKKKFKGKNTSTINDTSYYNIPQKKGYYYNVIELK